ncbi:MAG: hypothetical protein ACLPUG_05780 [Acidimicrobiales bacterium]
MSILSAPPARCSPRRRSAQPRRKDGAVRYAEVVGVDLRPGPSGIAQGFYTPCPLMARVELDSSRFRIADAVEDCYGQESIS